MSNSYICFKIEIAIATGLKACIDIIYKDVKIRWSVSSMELIIMFWFSVFFYVNV